MVVEEFLPMLAERGLRAAPADRIGLLGWSMGGYGALRLGGLLGPDRVAAVCAVSPAMWADPGDASRSGFADAAEYDEFTVQGRQDDLDGIPVRIDCGTGDQFYRAVEDYADGVPGRRRRHGDLRAGRPRPRLLAPGAACPARLPRA